MRLQRLRDRAARHDWFAVAIELTILIAGVFLGLQANNWNQQRLDQARGQDYRQRLIEDLRANLIDLDDRKNYYSQVKRYAQAALGALENPAADPAGLLANAYQASQITPRSVRRFAYDEIVSTGNVINLGAPALRDAVANYYTGVTTTSRTFDFIPPYREHLRAVMPNDVQQAVRRQCPETFEKAADGSVQARLPKTCSVVTDTAARGAAVLRAERGLREELARLIADADVKIALARALANHARELEAKVVAAD